MTTTHWLIVGLVGQTCFFMRFLIQWLVSEQRGESTIPLAFWYFSIGGSVILLSYSIYREDPVFIIGQSVGSMIYVRNLVLIARKNKTLAESINHE